MPLPFFLTGYDPNTEELKREHPVSAEAAHRVIRKLGISCDQDLLPPSVVELDLHIDPEQWHWYLASYSALGGEDDTI